MDHDLFANFSNAYEKKFVALQKHAIYLEENNPLMAQVGNAFKSHFTLTYQQIQFLMQLRDKTFYIGTCSYKKQRCLVMLIVLICE